MRFPTIGPHTPGGDLGAALREFAVSVRARLERFDTNPDAQIHGLRTDLKKLRSLLRLAGKSIPSDARRELVRIIRALKTDFAGARDHAVLKRLHDTFASIAPPPPGLFPESRVSPSPPTDAQRALARSLGDTIDTIAWTGVSPRDMERALRKTFRRGKSTMKRCRKKDAADADFHAWRKRVKDLWYQTVALRKAGKLKPTARKAKKLSDLLGEANDLANLLHRIHDAGTPVDPAFERRVRVRMTAVRRRALKRGAKLFSGKPPKLRE